MAMPFLLGFRVGDGDSAEPEQKISEESQPSEETVDEPFAEEKSSDDEKISDEKNSDEENQPEETPSDEENTRKIFGPPPADVEKRDTQVDENMRNYFQQFQGRRIVEINFEGASDATLPTVKEAIISHVGDEFDVDTAVRDRESIKNLGYFYEAYQTISEVPEGIILNYHMLENAVLRKINITGNTIFKADELEKMMTIKRGEILNSNTLHDNMIAIQEKYRGDGYILMKFADMNIADDGTLNLKISEGVLENYSVKGNKKTKDYVVLREMRQKVGEPFNAKLARRSMERVYNLGFFEDVNMKMNPGVEPNAIILEIDLKEKRTGTFGIGAGYSTRDGLIGLISIGDKNFRGTGDAISVAYETSADDTDAHGFAFTYRRPWLDRHETAGTIRIFNRTYEYSDYDTDGGLKERYMRRYSGGELALSRPMSEYSYNQITLKHRKDKYVSHVSSGKSGDRSGVDGEQWRNDNFGTTRSIELQHVTDTRDNHFVPTTGGRVALTAEFGGVIGGDFDFQKYNIDHQQFFKAGNHSQVWAMRGAYGLAHGDLTEFNQFRVGGQNTLRGYRDDQFRGNRMFLSTLEYRFPLAKKIQGILFTDWGSAWSSGIFPKVDDIYGSAGLGIALNTPLGPLRLDYGRGKQGGRFHFTVGGSF